MSKKIIFFSNTTEFRKWMDDHHETEAELFVGYYKIKSGKPSMTWNESVDEALSFGWIDGIRKSIDFESYYIRFTPRRSDSIWSEVNIKKVEQLTLKGLMRAKGLEAFNKRKDDKSGIYSFEDKFKQFDEIIEAEFRINSEAWNYFCKLPPSHQKTTIHWIMSAKQENTRLNRLEKAINTFKLKKRLF